MERNQKRTRPVPLRFYSTARLVRDGSVDRYGHRLRSPASKQEYAAFRHSATFRLSVPACGPSPPVTPAFLPPALTRRQSQVQEMLRPLKEACEWCNVHICRCLHNVLLHITRKAAADEGSTGFPSPRGESSWSQKSEYLPRPSAVVPTPSTWSSGTPREAPSVVSQNTPMYRWSFASQLTITNPSAPSSPTSPPTRQDSGSAEEQSASRTDSLLAGSDDENVLIDDDDDSSPLPDGPWDESDWEEASTATSMTEEDFFATLPPSRLDSLLAAGEAAYSKRSNNQATAMTVHKPTAAQLINIARPCRPLNRKKATDLSVCSAQHGTEPSNRPAPPSIHHDHPTVASTATYPGRPHYTKPAEPFPIEEPLFTRHTGNVELAAPQPRRPLHHPAVHEPIARPRAAVPQLHAPRYVVPAPAASFHGAPPKPAMLMKQNAHLPVVLRAGRLPLPLHMPPASLRRTHAAEDLWAMAYSDLGLQEGDLDDDDYEWRSGGDEPWSWYE